MMQLGIPNTTVFALLVGLCFASMWPSHSLAAGRPLSHNLADKLAKADQLPVLTTHGANNSALQAKHPFNPAAPVLRFAERLAVRQTPLDSGRWERLPKTLEASPQQYVWRLVVHSPGAVSLSLGFAKYRLPEGAALYIYAPDGDQLMGAFTARDNEEHGQLWTPLLRGDKVIIELNIPHDKLGDFELELGSVNHGFRLAGPEAGHATGQKAATEPVYKSGSCNIDVVCPQGDPWRPQIRSAAVYVIGGTTVCSGAAINNVRNDATPYFLTAAHCDITAQNAPSMVVYWNFKNSYCRQLGSSENGEFGDGTFTQFNTGAILRAFHADSDAALVELDDPIPPEYNVYLAGWDNRSNPPTSSVTLHHPSGDEQRISLDSDPAAATGEFTDTPDTGTHLRIGNWEQGVTEAGSSGAPLFNQNGHIVGQLTGGASACGIDGPDWFGRFHRSWSGSGTADSQLSFWLDPDGTGTPAIEGRSLTPASGFLPAIYHLLLN